MLTITRRRFLASSAALAAATVVPRALAGSDPTRASDWPSHGWGPAQTRHNRRETAISPASVPRLRPVWEFTAGSGITATPAVVGDRVIVASWDGTVHALDRRCGKTLWTFTAGVRDYPPDRRLGVFASPAVAGDAVYVACDRLVALDLATGRPRWDRIIGDPERTLEYFWAPPLAHGGSVYAGVSAGSETRTRGRIVCVDATTGTERWTFFTVGPNHRGGALIAPPSLDPGARTLFAATGNPFDHGAIGAVAASSDDPLRWSVSLLALDARTGALRWGDQVHPRDTRNLDLNCPPMLIEVTHAGRRRDLVVAGGKDGIRAWDRSTRERLWHVQLTPALPPGGSEALPTTGPEAGPTAAADGLVFFASNNHPDKTCVLAALEAATGELRWLHSLPAYQFAPPAVAGGVVFLGLIDGRLRAWRASDGEPLWESPAGEAIAGGPAVARGMVFVGTGAGQFLPGKRLRVFAPDGSPIA